MIEFQIYNWRDYPLSKNFKCVSAMTKKCPLAKNKIKNWIVVSILYEPLKTSAAAILSMLKDRANGGRARFYLLLTFEPAVRF